MKPQEFLQLWGQGIKNITPIQFSWINLQGTIMVIVGVLIGLYATFDRTWWLFIILCGSLFLTLVSLVQLIQRIIVLYEFQSIGEDTNLKGGTRKSE